MARTTISRCSSSITLTRLHRSCHEYILDLVLFARPSLPTARPIAPRAPHARPSPCHLVHRHPQRARSRNHKRGRPLGCSSVPLQIVTGVMISFPTACIEPNGRAGLTVGIIRSYPAQTTVSSQPTAHHGRQDDASRKREGSGDLRATSTISIPTMFNPFMDWTILRSSLEDQPPDSGVPAVETPVTGSSVLFFLSIPEACDCPCHRTTWTGT